MSSLREAPSLRNGIAAAAAVNLGMLYEWSMILYPERTSLHWGLPSAESCWAAVAVVVMAFFGGWAATKVMFRWRSPTLRAAFDWLLIASLLFIVNSVRQVLGVTLPVVNLWLGTQNLPSLAAIALVPAVVLHRNRRVIARAVATLLVALSPLAAWNVARAAITALTADFTALNHPGPTAKPIARRPGPRAIVIVFDEMDYQLAFVRRPAEVRLPMLDRFRSEGFFATAAFPPGRETALAMPGYLLGEHLDSIVRNAPDRLLGRVTGDSIFRDVGSSRTLFDDARGLGAPSEMVGFYLPYCRWQLAAVADRCLWQPITRGGIADGPVGFVGAFERQVLSSSIVGNAMAHVSRIERLEQEGVRSAGDSTLRLVFLHVPIPHFPPVWDAKKVRFTYFAFRTSVYFDNLALADRILARIVAATHDAGLDDVTSFVVTSDHPWRSGPVGALQPGREIPFIVRLPDHRHVEWSDRFEAIRLRVLVRSLLAGDIRTTPQLVAWVGEAGQTRW